MQSLVSSGATLPTTSLAEELSTLRVSDLLCCARLDCRYIAAFWWCKVDCLIKVAIEESRFDIDLIAFKVEMVDKREEYPD